MSQTPRRPDLGSPPNMPRWVKIMIVSFIVLVLAVILMHLAGFNFGGHMPHIR